MKEAWATIRVVFPYEKRAVVVFDSLRPETEIPLTQRSKVEVKRDERALILFFKAKDTTALRASVNSYMRWIMVMDEVLTMSESFQPF